jgi:SNF2 family DNA or RNA helicase
MTLVLPEPLRKYFKPATLSTAANALTKSRIGEVLFFRNAYITTIAEAGIRNFQVRFLLDGAERLSAAYCSCSPELKGHDLCRHVAMAMTMILPEEGGPALADSFAASLWHDVGQLLDEEAGSVHHRIEGHRIETSASDEAVILTLDFGGDPSNSLLCCYPDQVRPSEAMGLPMREQLLRKMAVTAQETELAKRGSLSRKQRWEASFWYGWSRAAFSFFVEHDLTLHYSGEEWLLEAARGTVKMTVRVPRRAVSRLLERDAGAFAARSSIALLPGAAVPDLALEVNPGGELHLVPMIRTVIDGEEIVEKRREADLRRFDRWVFYPKSHLFASLSEAPPRFAEAAEVAQASLFSVRTNSGYPRDRESVIGARDVFRFLEKHQEEIRSMPPRLIPESIRNAAPTRLAGPVRFTFGSVESEVELTVDYRAADEWISWRQIADVRKGGGAVLIAGSLWIDVRDPQFAWMDALPDTALQQATLRLSRLDYIRVRSSVRGPIEFEGNRAAGAFFRSFEDLRHENGAPRLTELGIDLYGYQQTGYQWLWFLQQNSLGGLLCDDMGLGKTHQAMALLRALTEQCSTTRILIVCPTSLLDHWRDKLTKYVPAVRFEMYYGGRRELSATSQAVVTSYGTLRNDIDEFGERQFDVMILDEAQIIKNAASQTHAAMSRVKRNVTIGLTGTPVENHLFELRTLLDFVVPGYLPGPAEFERSFVQPIQERNDAGARMRLQQLVSPFVLRRTKSQVLDQLPPKIVDIRHCELTVAQRALYREVISGKARPLREQLGTTAKPSYLHVFAVLNYLKQVCNHPATFDPTLVDAESGKFLLFQELLTEALQSGLKVVVFSQYVRMLKLIEKYLDEQRIGWATIKGDTRDRGRMIERFRVDPDCRVFTASLRAGGLGIDLTSASVVIHYDRWWNQAREDQATDRVHRLGQNKGVQVIKLITRGTLEEKIDAIIARKAQLAEDAVGEDDPTLVKQFSPDELREMLADI